MRFQVQLFDAADARWHNLAGADSGFVDGRLGPARPASRATPSPSRRRARGRALPPARRGHLRVARGRRGRAPRAQEHHGGASRTRPARTRPASVRRHARSLDAMPAAADERSMSRRVAPSSSSSAALALAPAGALAKAARTPTCGRPSTSATRPPSRAPSACACRSRARRARRSSGRASACSGSTAPSAPGAWCAPGGDAGLARIGIGARLVQGGTTFTFPLPEAGLAHRPARARRRRVARRHRGRRPRAPEHDRRPPRRQGPSAARVALVVRDHAVANSRGSFVMTPVTPMRVELGDPRRVVDRPHVELAAGLARSPAPGAGSRAPSAT